MKISTLTILSVTLLLSSCAHLDGKYHHGYNGEAEDATTGKGEPVDYGPRTPYEEFRVEERKLTAEIESALGAENLAVVIAYDFLGNVISYESYEVPTEDAVYPKMVSQLAKPYSIMFIPYEGSHCVDVIDSAGNAGEVCLPRRH